MKTAIKIVKIAIIMIVLLILMTSICVVEGNNSVLDPGNMAQDIKPMETPATQEVVTIGNKVVGIITTVGVVVAVIILLVLGIKYMMGSPSDKSEYKKSMLPYIIGAFCLFGASAIVKIVVNLTTLG